VVLFRTSLSDFEKNWGWLVTVTLAIGACVDITIAILLCCHLFKERKASFQRTTKLIDRIILMTLQTGFLTSLLTIAVVVTFEAMMKSYVWVALYMCLARVFSNSLFATLNAREFLRKIADPFHSLRFAHTTPKQFSFEAAKRPRSDVELEHSAFSHEPPIDVESASPSNLSGVYPAGIAL